jgi:hypothetical protein
MENHLTNSDRRRAVWITQRDPELETVLGSRQGRLAALVPVATAGGTELEGAVVTVITKLEVRGDLDTGRVLEIVPAGPGG